MKVCILIKSLALIFTLCIALSGCGGGSDSTITVVVTPLPDEQASIEITGTPSDFINEGSLYSFVPTVTTAANGTIVFSINNKPSWTTFNTSNGALTGTPSNTDVGVHSTITITATDDLASSSIGPFTIAVSAISSGSGIVISGSPNGSVNEESAYSFTPSITTPAVGTVVYSISNKPSWAIFNTSNGALTGIPDDANIGTDSNITITATDNIGTSDIGPFSITVNAVNDPPVLADQTKSGLTFSSNVAFSVSASDVDSAASTYVYNVVSAPTYGSIVISDHETSALEYQPSAVTGINGDSFSLELSDGSDTSATVTITLAFSDATAPALTLSPSNGAGNVAVDSTFVISSDDPLDTTTITYNNSAAACTGTLQISKDSFTNCIGITSAVASSLNRTITITSAADMDNATEYKMKVTTGVDNLLGVSVAADVTNTFDTVAGASSIVISGTPSASINEEVAYSFTPTIDTPANGTAVFSITNKPNWAAFSTSDGALTGIPDDANIGTDSNITITATDNIGTSDIGPFSITVNAVNDPPVLADQTKSGLTFSSNVAFSVSASDVDSAASTYVYNVVSAPTYGSIVISDHETSALEYQPSAVTGINGDSFSLELSDGSDTSATVTITLAFSDATAPALTLSPSNGAGNVAVDSTFVISSDDPLDTTTITYNNSAAACTGTLQISKDSFTNCIGITSSVASNLNRTITITSSVDMDSATEYKMKVTTGVDNLLGVSVASDVASTFDTASSSGLLITEISETYYVNTQRWFEIYNGTASTVDISDYNFRSLAFDGSNVITVTFSLPSVNLTSGQYLVVRANTTGDSYTPTSRIVYVESSGTYPYWGASGFIELLKAGVTEDFVTFGSDTSPTTASAWSGTFATAVPNVQDQYGHSIGRDGSNSDTNTAADWSSYDFATMGGTNDVTCTTDADADGIPDCSEVSGSTFAGMPLYEWGARTGQKDIFIEVDYMDSTNGGAQSADEGITPRQEALQNVVDAFSAQGIAVHFDVGDLYDQNSGTDPVDFDLGGGEEVPFVDAMTFSTSPSVYDYKLNYMDYSRMQIFHYLIFVNTQSGASGSSGLAELNGNDLIVSLGEWSLDSTIVANENELINYQASTLMHELGHNLGLKHGGDDDTNDKPNYFSIMNYTYQLYGLSETGNNEGDRFYLAYYYNGGSPDADCFVWPLNKSSTTTDFIMDFSHGDSVSINSASVNETLGLGQISSDGVDYNCDGDVTDTAASITGGSGTYSDYDDWGNLDLDFQRNSSGFNSGAMLVRSSDTSTEFELMADKVGDDRSPIAEEYAPSADFFERLRHNKL